MERINGTPTKVGNLGTPWAAALHELASDDLASSASERGVVSAEIKCGQLRQPARSSTLERTWLCIRAVWRQYRYRR